MSERHEQRAAEHEQRVGDRWTTTGKADAATDPVLRDLPVRPFADGADAAKPTLKPYWRRSPWWWWT